MSGWLDLNQLGLSPNQKHQALLGAPKIVHCGEQDTTKAAGIVTGGLFLFHIEVEHETSFMFDVLDSS
jgi:hypothetical protein